MTAPLLQLSEGKLPTHSGELSFPALQLDGSSCLFVGRAGAVVSTLMRPLSLRPTSRGGPALGDSLVAGDKVDAAIATRRVALVPRALPLGSEENVYRGLADLMSPLGIQKALVKATIEKACPRALRTKVKNLSQFEAQLCLWSTAHLGNPEVVLFEEPLEGLKSDQAERVFSLMTNALADRRFIGGLGAWRPEARPLFEKTQQFIISVGSALQKRVPADFATPVPFVGESWWVKSSESKTEEFDAVLARLKERGVRILRSPAKGVALCQGVSLQNLLGIAGSQHLPLEALWPADDPQIS